MRKEKCLVSCLLFAVVCHTAVAAVPPRHFLAAGWDVGGISVGELDADLDELAALPIDGFRFVLKTWSTDGKKLPYWPTTAMDGEVWPAGCFDNQLAAARRLTALPNMRHSFLGVRTAPNRRLAWTDDRAWASVSNNLAVLARFARESGMKGLVPDFEDYKKAYQYELADDDPDWRTTVALARQRGRELFGGVFAEYPEATLFLWHFLNPRMPDFETCEDVTEVAKCGHDLHYAFFNGVFDVLPPTARVVAAEEQLYDRRAENGDFYKGSSLERKHDPYLLAESNRAKFRNQTSIGFDLYLDAFRPDNAKSTYFRGKGSWPTETENFLRNLEQAAKASDEYVWFWAERQSWVHWRNPSLKDKKTWDETLPGLYEGLRRVRDVRAYATAKLAELRAAGAPNLAKNPTCETTKDFTFWIQPPTTNGTMSVDTDMGCSSPGSLVLTGAKGCATTFLSGLHPGERYLLKVCFRSEGDAAVGAAAAWKTNDKWDFKKTRCRLERNGEMANGWKVMTAIATVPDGADGFGLSLGTTARPGQRVWFDDVEIYRVP